MTRTNDNPQDYLPIGQMVKIPAGILAPYYYTENDRKRCNFGKVVEHFNGNCIAVHFDLANRTFDYPPSEARQFSKVY